jgi:hypothetical protein
VSYYRFGPDDVIRNVVKTNPTVNFYIYGGVVYFNNKPYNQGPLSEGNENHVPPGYVSLYEMNVDRPTGNLVYPFITKQGSLTAFKTVTSSSFNEDFKYGDTVTGSYPLSASITRQHFQINTSRPNVDALKNTLNYYANISKEYSFSSSFIGANKGTQPLTLVSIPSIFYGSQMEKGAMELNFYVSGTLIGTLKDEKRNGELIQTGPVGSGGSGSVAGVALYNEGFLVLTGSWDITSGQHTSENYGVDSTPNWLKFAIGAQDGVTISSQKSAWELKFRGSTRTPVVTMFAHAPRGRLNHSNNPTYIKYGQQVTPDTGSSDPSTYFKENANLSIKNTVSASYTDSSASFAKQTYISKIGIYDENKNLIGIAKLATPIKKTEDRNLTFKLKLDI